MSVSQIPLAELQRQYAVASDNLAAIDRQISVLAAAHKAAKKEKDRLAALIQAALKRQPAQPTTPDWIEAKLGKSFLQLNPGYKEARPTVWERAHVETSEGFGNVINPYEVGNYVDPADLSKGMMGPHVVPIEDFARDSANIVLNRVGGLIRVQADAWDMEVHALSPRYDVSGGDPDPSRDIYGGAGSYVVATARCHAGITNEALVLYDDNVLALAQTQTSRNWDKGERNFPSITFPPSMKMRGVALTTCNEFALVAMQDTGTGRGKVAVVAMEGSYLPDQTWPWIGLLNQGSWSDMKLLGYVDLGFAEPDSIDAASNAFYAGPSATHDKKLSQLDIRDPDTHSQVFGPDDDGNLGMGSLVARGGFFVVASKTANAWAVYDMRKLFQYVRNFYDLGQGVFPTTFDVEPITPELALAGTMEKPAAVLAGRCIDRWTVDCYKAFIAQESGLIHIVDTSSIMARWSWEKRGTLLEMGTFQAGANPTCLTWTRGRREVWINGQSFYGGWTDGLGVFHASQSDGYGNDFIVVSRGTRQIQFVATLGGAGVVYRTIDDAALVDPVAAYMNLRDPVLTVLDYTGQKVVNYRIGGISERLFPYEWGKFGPVHGCGPDDAGNLECGGTLATNGKPWLLTSSNVN